MHCQIQPLEIAPPRNQPLHLEVEEEIQHFLHALDSYPARVAKEPKVSFHQHLCSIFAVRSDRPSRRQ